LVCVYSLVKVTLVMPSATVPTLVSVTVCAALAVFKACVPKLKVVGESVMSAPVPVRATVCGLPVALSVSVMAPVLVPAAVGTNFTVTVQSAPPVSDVPQLFVCVKSPLAAMLVILRVAVPLLVRVTVFAVLVVLICCEVKVRLLTDKLTVVLPAVVPVPVSETTWGLPPALSVMVIVPV
jgi:hypothetical protein